MKDEMSLPYKRKRREKEEKREKKTKRIYKLGEKRRNIRLHGGCVKHAWLFYSLQEKPFPFQVHLINVFSGQNSSVYVASPRHVHLREVFFPQDQYGIILFKNLPRSFPTQSPNKNKKAASDAASAGWVAPGARCLPLRPAGVPEEAAVFLGPRRSWVGTARGRAGFGCSSLSGA